MTKPVQGLMARPVTNDRWSDLEALFQRPGPRGGTPMPGSCWCMWWRERSGDATTNERAMRAIVRDGPPPGLLAYRDGDPVGWVSIAPRPTYGQLLRSRKLRPTDDPSDEGVYAVACFYVDRAAKGSGVSRFLLEAAVAWAAEQGASAIEAYPSARGDYMGHRALYERLGFRADRDTGNRTVVRLTIKP